MIDRKPNYLVINFECDNMAVKLPFSPKLCSEKIEG